MKHSGDFTPSRSPVERSLAQRGVQVCGLIESISDLVWEADPAGCATFFGPRLEAFTGYTPADVVGKPLSFMFCQNDEKTFADLFRNDAHPEPTSRIETVLRRADGAMLTVEVTIAPMFEDGQLVAHYGVLKDVSERKHAELLLKRSELLLCNALSLTKAAPWEYDVQSDLFVFNDMFYDIFGTSVEEVGTYEMTPDDYAERFVHPDERHVVRNGIKLFLETPDPNYNRYLEHRFLYANGQIGEIAVRFHILKDASGRTIKCYGVNQDITQQKNAERIKSEFVSTVTHELRTPLTSVVGSLGLLRSGAFGEFSQKAARMINMAYDNGSRLAHLINDMLEIDKIEAGQLVFKVGVSSLNELLQEAADLNGAFAEQRGVTIVLDAVPPDVVVETDPDRFQQVMANLISNALKFSPAGEKITVSAQMVGPAVRISVADRGPGIPHEFRNRVFQKFAQADGSDARQTGGTGLGLSASKAMVERMGGQIGYTTKEGKGTTFYFDLLAHREPEPDPKPPAPSKVSIQSLYP